MSLRTDLKKLASEKPELRKHLLPLLRKNAAEYNDAQDVHPNDLPKSVTVPVLHGAQARGLPHKPPGKNPYEAVLIRNQIAQAATSAVTSLCRSIGWKNQGDRAIYAEMRNVVASVTWER